MKKAAYIVSLITTIIEGTLLIPLIWLIPMTIKMHKASKGEADLSLGFKICALIFDNFVAGILLLASHE